MRAYRGVPKAPFMGAVRAARAAGLWVPGAYLGRGAGGEERGCIVGLGAAIACRLAGSAAVSGAHPAEAGPYYAAAAELLGIPGDLCLAADLLFEAAPGDHRPGELAEVFYDFVREGADLSGAAAAYAQLASRLGGAAPWEDRAERLLAALPRAA